MEEFCAIGAYNDASWPEVLCASRSTPSLTCTSVGRSTQRASRLLANTSGYGPPAAPAENFTELVAYLNKELKEAHHLLMIAEAKNKALTAAIKPLNSK
jgi:hypothetical protein